MFQSGQQVGHYTLINLLGRGGFGEVWLAEHRTALLIKKVAVKLPLDSAIDLEIVRREAVLWGQASGHGNVLPIIEANIYNGQVAIISEYAEGGTLADVLKTEGKLSPRKAVELALGILSGLSFLHSKRIIHRDLKPANILLQGGNPRLTDFGISHLLQTSSSGKSTHIKGTFAYMSPETFDGVRSEQTDIWSFGVVLYQMLSGKLPFPQEDMAALFGAINKGNFAPLSQDVSFNLKEIVNKCLANPIEQRYRTTGEIYADLDKELVRLKHPTDAPTDILSKDKLKSLYDTNQDIKPKPKDLDTIVDEAEETDPPINPKPDTGKEKSDTPPDDKQLTDADLTLPPTKEEKESEIIEPLPKPLLKNKLLLAALFVGVPILLYLGISGVGKLVDSLKTKRVVNIIEPTLIPFRKGDKWGYVDKNKIIKIEPKYDYVQPFENGYAKVKRNSGISLTELPGETIIDTSGKEISVLSYGFIYRFSEDLALTFKGSGIFKDTNVFKIGYDAKNAGYLDKKGNVAIPFNYEWGCSFSEGLACVKFSNKYGYIDKQGNTILAFHYDDAGSFNKEGLAPVKLNGKWSLIDKRGQVVKTLDDEVYTISFNEGWLPVKKANGLYNFIDKTGKYLSSTDFELVNSFYEGISQVKSNGKWGFIDASGNQVIPFKYEDATSYREGLFPVKQNGKWGFVDENDKIIIPFKYYYALTFDNGVAYVKNNENDAGFYITRDGMEYLDTSATPANTNTNTYYNINSNINLNSNNVGQNSNTNTTTTKLSAFTNKVGMEFVQIPAGTFTMGNLAEDAYANSDDLPTHQVTFAKPFYMGRYEVTQAQWKAVAKSNPSFNKGDDNLPVNSMDWNLAQSFIKKLNELNDGYIYRLPSEAEWEYACRAGTKGDYAGNKEEMRSEGKSEVEGLYPVGQTKPNAWGLYDMHGNVAEWVADVWHHNYKGAPTDGSAWTSGGVQAWRILRGKSNGQSYIRQEAKIIDTFGDNGLRVVAIPKSSSTP